MSESSRQFEKGSWPYYDSETQSAVQRVLSSGRVNYWTGDEGKAFEQEYATYLGRRHAVAVANGTLALELALRVLGVGPGDEVVTTSRTFIASASCAVAVGARPVFADVDRDSQNLTADTIRAVITPATKAIIAVHLGGWPCDMDPILELARTYGIKVIEDCAQAHGAQYKGRTVGSIGDIGAFSFCQDKIISTGGEGGLIALDNDSEFERAWSYKDHGKSFDAVYRRQHPVGFRWLHESFGSNWRLTEIQSVIGRMQLKKLEYWVALRRQIAKTLVACMETIPSLRVPVPGDDTLHAYYRCYAFVRAEELRDGWSRDRIVFELSKRGVGCNVGSCSEVYLEKAFPIEWRPAEPLPVAHALGSQSIAFLVYPTMTPEEVAATCRDITEVMQQASR